jgi:hypothetical protein
MSQILVGGILNLEHDMVAHLGWSALGLATSQREQQGREHPQGLFFSRTCLRGHAQRPLLFFANVPKHVFHFKKSNTTITNLNR